MECRFGAYFCWICFGDKHECGRRCYDDEGVDSVDGEEHATKTRALSFESFCATASNVHRHIQSLSTDPYDSGEALPNKTILSAEMLKILPFAIHYEDMPPDPSTTPNPTIQPPVQPPNLDRGSHKYCEDQTVDFGDEPGDDILGPSWNCKHTFHPHTVRFASALANNGASAGMKCSKCWSSTYPDFIPHCTSAPSSQIPVAGRTRLEARGHAIQRLNQRRSTSDCEMPGFSCIAYGISVGSGLGFTSVASSPLSVSPLSSARGRGIACGQDGEYIGISAPVPAVPSHSKYPKTPHTTYPYIHLPPLPQFHPPSRPTANPPPHPSSPPSLPPPVSHTDAPPAP
ncbi:hypothetical protein IAQ61_011505 [Plenodomus lingam]|uniref:uncharacterized protein n=1 Tax=Leptosphaeria maculans TaxID=5022 RepID=UPI00331E0FC2|nr:hypothetical protein IAQ61_011505 [Plenodomus lingam]